MKNTSYALALVCCATLAAGGCASNLVTGPDAEPSAAVVADAKQAAGVAGGVEKVEICHIPPGNPGNEHTITVGSPAVPAHLAHGDHLGACGGK
jgi:hypothetical protein